MKRRSFFRAVFGAATAAPIVAAASAPASPAFAGLGPHTRCDYCGSWACAGCLNGFPRTPEERYAAASDPGSPFYQCGYSPEWIWQLPGREPECGEGNFDARAAKPFTSCS